MACRRYMFLLVAAAFVAVALSEEVPCMTSREDCTQGIGYSTLIIINDNFHCCAAGYSMRWDDSSDKCFCDKTSEVVACTSSACGKNDSVVSFTNKNNVTECCQAGMTMTVFQGTLNGTKMDSCSCSSSSTWGLEVVSYSGANTSHIHFNNYLGMPHFSETSFNNWISHSLSEMREAFRRLFDDYFYDEDDYDDDYDDDK